jgi:hypothetical protein
MQLVFALVPWWPPLTWCAEFDQSSRVIVRHGNGLETAHSWFCEGVWDGNFEDGAFAASDNFFGSGGVIKEENEVIFVSSSAPMERLHHITTGSKHLISNSLACLMAQAHADIDPAYATFEEESFNITKGIYVYAQTLQTTRGLITMTICRNLCYKGGSLYQIDKEFPKRRFETFSTYESFLRKSLKQISANMKSPARKITYSFYSGISSGYDSPMVCALAKEAGLTEAFSFTKARGNLDHDDGSAIGEQLGVSVKRIDRYSWKAKLYPEVPFIVAVGKESGVELAGVENLQRTVYLSGMFGDEIWGVLTPPESISKFKRKEHTGLDLSEFRLWNGFIHVPVPYLGYYGFNDILSITKSQEMKPWDVSNTPYEHYSRPIPRRVLEEAGVPRRGFAHEKRAATYGDFETNWTKRSLTEIYAFNRVHGLPHPSLLGRVFFVLVIGLSEALLWLGRQRFKGSSRTREAGKALRKFRSYEFSFNRSFPWALRKAISMYEHPSK